MVGAAGSVGSLILSGLLKISSTVMVSYFQTRACGYIFRGLIEEKVQVSAGILSVHTHYISDPSDINKNLLVIQIQKHVKFYWA